MRRNVQVDAVCLTAVPQGSISTPLECLPPGRARTEQSLNRELCRERSARREAEFLLAEKEELLAHNHVLLREIDHRVKNSLQLVASALSLQARRSVNDDVRKVLEEACNRVAAVAAMHSQLSRPSASGHVSLDEFLAALCRALIANKPDNIDNVMLSLAHVKVRPELAMKMGALVAELVINAFKHAYALGEHGDVRIKLECLGRACRLVVEDDGFGIPEGYASSSQQGLGLRLVRSIVNQLGGTVSFGLARGTQFVIIIPE